MTKDQNFTFLGCRCGIAALLVASVLGGCGDNKDGSLATTDAGGTPKDAAADATGDGGERDGATGDGQVALFDATFMPLDSGPREASIDILDCVPGKYVGTYKCQDDKAFPEGPLQFELEVNERKVDAGSSCQEFCDLVIKEGTATLAGNWTVASFEGRLEGGLDCSTGEFQATVTDGVWGLPNPDGNGVLVPLSTFQASIQAMYAMDDDGETIEGEWMIRPDISMDAEGCQGDIVLERMGD